jgi:hypothetical protein
VISDQGPKHREHAVKSSEQSFGALRADPGQGAKMNDLSRGAGMNKWRIDASIGERDNKPAGEIELAPETTTTYMILTRGSA